MDWQSWVPVAQVLGPAITATSIVVAVAVFILSQLQREADKVRDIIYECEREFGTLVQEYDRTSITRLVGEIVSHPSMEAVAEALWGIREKSDKTYTDMLRVYEADIAYAIKDAISKIDSARLRPSDDGFRRAMYRIGYRYPVLHALLRTEYAYMRAYVGYMRWADKYQSIIGHYLRTVKDDGTIATMPSSQTLRGFLHGYILYHLTQDIRNDKLDWFFETLESIMTAFLSVYKRESDFGLWCLSNDERYLDVHTYQKDTMEDSLVALVNLRAYQLGDYYRRAIARAEELRDLLASKGGKQVSSN